MVQNLQLERPCKTVGYNIASKYGSHRVGYLGNHITLINTLNESSIYTYAIGFKI